MKKEKLGIHSKTVYKLTRYLLENIYSATSPEEIFYLYSLIKMVQKMPLILEIEKEPAYYYSSSFEEIFVKSPKVFISVSSH